MQISQGVNSADNHTQTDAFSDVNEACDYWSVYF